jgi:hypothetical protein
MHVVIQAKADRELAEKRAAEKAARSYDLIDTPQDEEDEDAWDVPGPAKKTTYASVREMEDDFM